MSKRNSEYIQLLKEAVLEYDAKEFEKGPLLEPIITYTGSGELETHKDASSILERYYFKEQDDSFDFEDSEPAGEEPEENEIVTGEEPDDTEETMDDLEDEILDESIFGALFEDEEVGEEGEKKEDEKSEDKDEKKDEDVTEDFDLLEDANDGHDDGGGEDVDSNPEEDSFDIEDDNSDVFENPEEKPFEGEVVNQESLMLENAIIDKLIMEMEEAEEDAGEDPDNEQAGTDLVDEKDVEDELKEDMDLFEDDDLEGEDSAKDKEDEDLDVDKEVGSVKEEADFRMGPLGNGTLGLSAKGQIEEAFRIFKEQIEEEGAEDEKKEDKKEDEKDEDEEVTEDFDLFEDIDFES